MRPNFSRVRLTKIWRRTSATSHSKKKKVSATLKVSLSFNNRHTIGSYRGLNQSEIVKGGPSRWLAVVQIFLYVWCVCCCSQTEREGSSRDARSVANFARFSAFLDPHSDLVTSWTNFRESLWSLVFPRRREISARSSFSASALFSERLRGAVVRSVKTDIIASLNVHANIAKITAQELSLSCFILCIIWFHQTTAQ